MDYQNRAGGNVRKNFHIKINPIKLTFDRIFEEDWEKEDALTPCLLVIVQGLRDEEIRRLVLVPFAGDVRLNDQMFRESQRLQSIDRIHIGLGQAVHHGGGRRFEFPWDTHPAGRLLGALVDQRQKFHLVLGDNAHQIRIARLDLLQ